MSLYSWLSKKSCRIFLGHFPSPDRSIIAPFSSLLISPQTHQKWGTHIGAAKSAVLHLVMTPIQLCSAQILTLKDKMPLQRNQDSHEKHAQKVHEVKRPAHHFFLLSTTNYTSPSSFWSDSATLTICTNKPLSQHSYQSNNCSESVKATKAQDCRSTEKAHLHLMSARRQTVERLHWKRPCRKAD